MEVENNRSAQKEEQFRNSLKFSSDELIVSTLETIRESGDEYMILPLIELLFKPLEKKTKESVVSFLADLKNQNAVGIITKSISDNRNHKDLHYLVSACWQSRLNFSQYIDIFIDLICNADFQTSIEAYTSIENMLEKFNKEERTKHAKTLKMNYVKASSDKSELIKSLIVAIENYEDEPNYGD